MAYCVSFPCHFQCFGGQPAVRRERHCPPHGFPRKQIEYHSKVSLAFTRPDIRHIAAPYLVRLCHCKLTSEVIRDSNMLVSPTFISVNKLLTTYQPQLLHETAGKPSPHPEAPECGHRGDTSCTSRAMTETVQFLNLTT